MISTILELAGLASLVFAAFLGHPIAGFSVLGVMLIAAGAFVFAPEPDDRSGSS